MTEDHKGPVEREGERWMGAHPGLNAVIAVLRRKLEVAGVDPFGEVDQWVLEAALEFQGDLDELEEWAALRVAEIL
jgi:tRNA threonylcarbamoyladenosine modification (KEOPS) complex Cgi121 subunit